MEAEHKPKLHYAWITLIGAMLVAITCQGPLGVCTSNLISPVVAELGCSVSSFTLYVSISAVVMAFLYPVASKFLSTKYIGYVIALGIIIEAAGYGLMATYRSVSMFYLSGVMLGLGGSIVSFMAFPILINMWFAKRAGFALGIIMACRGVGAAVFSPLFAKLIEAVGWRTSCVCVMIMAVAVSLPCSLLIFKRPQEKGVKPYGIEEFEASSGGKAAPVSDADWGVTLKEGLRSPVFYFVWITGMMFSIACGCGSYIASYSTMELGNAATISATAYSVMSVAGILCSLILGEINDRFGVKSGLVWGCSFQIAGSLLLIFSGGSLAMLMAGAACYGLGNGMYTLQVPLLVRSVLGGKHYTSIWPILMMGNSLVGGGAFSSLGLFYDKGGSYKGMFAFGITLLAIAFIMGIMAVNIGKKRREAAALDAAKN